MSCTDSTKSDVNAGAMPSTLLTQYAHSRWGIQSITDPRGVTRSYRRDWTGQLTHETDDFGATKQQTYDAGGLLATTVSRLGETVSYQYDAAGRLTRILYPQRVYGTRVWPSGWTAQTVPGDSIRYAYDVMGNQTSAINSDATIRRTYYGDGSLHAVYYHKDFVDSLVYTYDASGARKTLKHLTTLNGTTSTDSVTYIYNATTGNLDSMTVKWGGITAPRAFAFQWDGLGRRRQITYPGGTTVKNRYDANGQLRRVVSDHPGGTNDVLDMTFRTKAIDAAGRPLWQELTCGQYDGGGVSGSACGAASLSTWSGYNRRGMLVTQKQNSVTQARRYDGSGNLVYQRLAATSPYTIFGVDTLHNEITSSTDSGTSALTIIHDSSGARTFESSTSIYVTRGYYYDGLGRTVGMKAYVDQSLVNNWSACQYGPDGQMNRSCENNASSLTMDGANAIAAYNGSGLASFVHGTGLDDPLIALIRSASGGYKELVFITDGNGRQFAAADSTGYFDPDLNQTTQWQNWQYSGGSRSSNTFAASRLSNLNTPGLSFFRNRVYDQVTGRWTQEDPIGVAGGFNLYQFNGNNPVSYTDPFGLCPPKTQAEVAECVGHLLRGPEKLLNAYAAGVAAVATVGIGAELVAGGAVTTLGLASGSGGRLLLPATGGAITNLKDLSDKFGISPVEIANKAINSGTRLIDHLNGGNINSIVARPDGASGFVRVTLNPSGAKIISAGIQSANQVANGLENGRFTPAP